MEPILSDAATLVQARPLVVVAPDAFKGSLTSAEAAEAMAAGVLQALPSADVRLMPIADGGDGSVDALVRAGYVRLTFTTQGPDGGGARASLALGGRTAVVEVANSCGIALLSAGLAPMTSSTFGLGQAIAAALATDADRIVVCLGGSASTDGGAGMLTALGVRLLDDRGDVVPASGGTLSRIDSLDLAGLDPRAGHVRFVVATDVRSPLLGDSGAAAVFAPQKGASPDQVDALEAGLQSWASVLAEATGTDVRDVAGAGAAGGTGAALLAVVGAQPVSGAVFIQEEVGLNRALAHAALVVTGEGRLDGQSLLGKGAMSVTSMASAAGVPVALACGRIDLPERELVAAGATVWADLVSRAHDDADAVTRAALLLADATAEATRDWLATCATPPTLRL